MTVGGIYDEYGEQVDPAALEAFVDGVAEKAAERVTQGVTASIAAQQQAQLEQHANNLASAAAAQADVALEKRYGEAWRNDRGAIGDLIAREPGLIPEHALYEPQVLEAALDRAYELAQITSKREAERKAKAENDAFANNLVAKHHRTWAERMSSASVHDVLGGE